VLQAQTTCAQQQRATERQAAEIERLRVALAKRDVQLANERRNTQALHKERSAAESWLDH
jgi:hypothetical protein